MPVLFKIKDSEYQYPEGWQDVTLDKWLKSLDIKAPKVLTDLYKIDKPESRAKYVEEKVTPQVYGAEILPYYVEYVGFWSGVPESDAMALKVEQLEQLYQQIEINLNRSVEKYTKEATDTIEHKGRTYYLPTKHLTKGTVNEFIEAAHAEHLAKQLQGNQLHAIPKLLCIFLKSKKDAAYNPKQMEREPLFMSMTMDKVFKVSFFLLKLNEKLVQNSLIYMGMQRLAQLRHKSVQA